MKRSSLFSAGFASLVSVILLTGCSDSGTTAQQAPAGTPSQPAASNAAGAPSGASMTPESWANDFCGGLIVLQQEPNLAMPEIQEGDTAAAHRAFVKLASGLENYLSPGVEAFTKLPPSPISDGDAVKANVLAVFQPLLDQTRSARTQLEAAPEGDKQAVAVFAQSFQSLGNSLQGLQDKLVNAVNSAELEKAGENAPNCKKAAK